MFILSSLLTLCVSHAWIKYVDLFNAHEVSAVKWEVPKSIFFLLSGANSDVN